MSPSPCLLNFSHLQRLRLARRGLAWPCLPSHCRLIWSNTRGQSTSSDARIPSEIFAHWPWKNTPAFESIIAGNAQLDAQEDWVKALKPYFNEYLARTVPDKSQAEYESNIYKPRNDLPDRFLDLKIADLLLRAKWQGNHNLILHLASKGQWNMLSWIVRAISDRTYYMDDLPVMAYEPFAIQENASAKASRNPSLDSLLTSPLDLRSGIASNSNEQPHFFLPLEEYGRSRSISAMDASSAAHNDPRDHQVRTQRGALGEVLASLGQLVLDANCSEDTRASQDLMAHVLEILAIFHQNGLVPEYTYRCVPSLIHSPHAPPPYLEQLSQPILSSILDAQWNAFQDSPDLATFPSHADSEMYGVDFPEHNNPQRVLPFAHEIWLEVILWMCLRGGWVYFGMELLEKVFNSQNTHRWKARSWREFASNSSTKNTIVPSRTLSRELILAYSEALVDAVETGVGGRGIQIRQVFQSLQTLKSLLEESDTETASFNWGETLARLIDSSFSKLGSDLELGQSMMKIMLAKRTQYSGDANLYRGHLLPWSALTSAQQDSAQTADFVGKFLTSCIDHGQTYLVEDLLKRLKKDGFTLSAVQPDIEQEQTPSGRRKARSLSVAPEVIARLIHFLVDHRNQELQEDRLLYDTIGPLFSLEFRTHPMIGPSLVRYAVAVSDVDLLRDTLKDAVSPSGNQIHKENFMLALLLAQVERRRWDAAQATANLARSDASWQRRVVVALVKEILRVQGERIKYGEERRDDLAAALDVLRVCLARNIDNDTAPDHTTVASMFTILGILSTVDPGWANFASNIIHYRKTIQPRGPKYYARKTALHPNFFATILQGVADFGGPEAVRRVWTTWCERPQRDSHDKLNTIMPRHAPQVTEALYHSARPIEVLFPQRGKLAFSPRFEPNLTMIRVLLRSDYAAGPLNADLRDEAVRRLRVLGLEDWQIELEMERGPARGRWETYDSVAATLDLDKARTEPASK